jgi:hypothetical protein
MGGYRLTIRHGPKVAKERFDQLEPAIDAMEERVREIRREGPLKEINVLRDHKPNRRVHARLELSTMGAGRRRRAGIDLMGDGTLIPYSGAVRKRMLEPEGGVTPFEAVRAAVHTQRR